MEGEERERREGGREREREREEKGEGRREERNNMVKCFFFQTLFGKEADRLEQATATEATCKIL